MPGCDFQNKTFSVAVTENRGSKCRKCGTITQSPYRYNGDELCKECFSKIPGKGMGGIVNTHKDLQYNFVSEIFGNTPVEIRSQSQYKRLLKQNGMVDASPKEIKQEAAFRKRINAEDSVLKRKKDVESIFLKNKDRLRFRLKGR